MKQKHMLILYVGLGMVLVWGCSSTPSGSVDSGSSTQQETAKTAMDYRNLAAELREMAHRRELESEVLSKQQNPDQTRIAHWREMAQQLRKEADAAEQHAREMQEGVPHGMIQ